MEYYSIAPCPKCGVDAWQKRGGHHAIPIYYACSACGMDTLRIITAAKTAEERTNDPA